MNKFNIKKLPVIDEYHWLHGQEIWIMHFNSQGEEMLLDVNILIQSKSFNIYPLEPNLLQDECENHILFDLSKIFEINDFEKLIHLFLERNWLIIDDDFLEEYKKTLIRLKDFITDVKNIESIKIDQNFNINSSSKNYTNELKEFKKKYRMGNWNPKYYLYPKQLKEAYFLYKLKNGAIFSVPGTGKTITTLAAFNAHKIDNDDLKGIVMVGPTSSFNVWINEWLTVFKKLPTYTILSGKHKDTKDSFFEWNYTPELVCMHYSTFSSYSPKLIKYFKKNSYILVIDESHYLKNELGLWGTNARRLNNKPFGNIILTGTPLPNGYNDLNNYYRILYNNIISNYITSITNEIQPLYKNSTTTTSDELAEASKRLKPFYCRTTKTDLGMKPANFISKFSKFDDHQLENATKIINFYGDINFKGEFKIKNPLAFSIRWMQNSTNPNALLKRIEDTIDEDENDKAFIRNAKKDDIDFGDLNFKEYHGVTSKIKQAIELTQKLRSKNRRVLIWVWFRGTASIIKSELAKKSIDSRIYNGSIDLDNREKNIKEFRLNNEANVLIASLQTLSESVSLHKECKDAIFVEYNYDFAKFEQAQNRIHRYNKDNNNSIVNLYILQTDNNLSKKNVNSYKAFLDFDKELFNKLRQKNKAQRDMVENDLLIPINVNPDQVINELMEEIIEKWHY